RPAASKSSKSRPTSPTACAIARSATPPATCCAYRNGAELRHESPYRKTIHGNPKSRPIQQVIPRIHGRRTRRNEGTRTRIEERQTRRRRREGRAGRDRQDADFRAQAVRAIAQGHPRCRAAAPAEDLVRHARLRQRRRESRRLLQARVKIQGSLPDSWLQRPGKARRRRHVADVVCAHEVDCRRRKKDRSIGEESCRLADHSLLVIPAQAGIQCLEASGLKLLVLLPTEGKKAHDRPGRL